MATLLTRYWPRAIDAGCALTRADTDMIASTAQVTVMTAPNRMGTVVIKDSPIHGRGVFAAQRLAPGEVIIEGCRNILSDEAVAALPADEQAFVSVMNGKNIWMRPPSRFVNHSCNPNARGDEQHDVATRVIEAGEEITVDYADEVPGLKLECNCGAPNCRGLLG